MEPILLSDDTSASVSPIAINCCLTAEYKQCYSATAGGVTLCKSNSLFVNRECIKSTLEYNLKRKFSKQQDSHNSTTKIQHTGTLFSNV
jgi:hypothetical protein